MTPNMWFVSGKSEHIWDRFCHEGHVDLNMTGDVACDSYHKWQEDIQILKEVGVRKINVTGQRKPGYCYFLKLIIFCWMHNQKKEWLEPTIGNVRGCNFWRPLVACVLIMCADMCEVFLFLVFAQKTVQIFRCCIFSHILHLSLKLWPLWTGQALQDVHRVDEADPWPNRWRGEPRSSQVLPVCPVWFEDCRHSANGHAFSLGPSSGV